MKTQNDLVTMQAGNDRLIVTFKRNDGITMKTHFENHKEVIQKLDELNSEGEKWGETWNVLGITVNSKQVYE